jgi:hypothetical protein
VHAQRHLAYPVLHFFHSTQGRTATGPRVAALSETLRLIGPLPTEAQPPPASVRSAQSAIDGFLSPLSSAFIRHAAKTAHEVETGGRTEARRRRLLHALVRDDGWNWSDAVGEDPGGDGAARTGAFSRT